MCVVCMYIVACVCGVGGGSVLLSATQSVPLFGKLQATVFVLAKLTIRSLRV